MNMIILACSSQCLQSITITNEYMCFLPQLCREHVGSSWHPTFGHLAGDSGRWQVSHQSTPFPSCMCIRPSYRLRNISLISFSDVLSHGAGKYAGLSRHAHRIQRILSVDTARECGVGEQNRAPFCFSTKYSPSSFLAYCGNLTDLSQSSLYLSLLLCSERDTQSTKFILPETEVTLCGSLLCVFNKKYPQKISLHSQHWHISTWIKCWISWQ